MNHGREYTFITPVIHLIETTVWVADEDDPARAIDAALDSSDLHECFGREIDVTYGPPQLYEGHYSTPSEPYRVYEPWDQKSSILYADYTLYFNDESYETYGACIADNQRKPI